MSNKNPRLQKDDITAGMYPVGTDQYVRLVHLPTGISVGKELHGKAPEHVRSELMRYLQTKVAAYEKEQQRKSLRIS